MAFLLSTAASMAKNKLSDPAFRNKIKSTLISTAKAKLIPRVQAVVDKYKDDACTNPPVFMDRVIEDMKAAKFFPSPIRMAVEMHRSEVESQMRELLADPEFQQGCKTADVAKITDELVKAMEEGSNLHGGKRRRRRISRRRVNRSRRRTHRRRN